MDEPAAVGAMPVFELVEDAVVAVLPDTSLREVAEALAGANIGIVVVGDAERVSGVISERDVVRAVAGRKDPVTTQATDIANSPIWCDATATIAEVAEEMMEHYVRHILVEEDGRFVGVVSARDLLGAYAAADVEFE
jgi:CBS domain-containing protein